ncbi:hypothetical protein AAFF_G00147460 [Aldrovandia affinis]|uniref:Uncharacterized protein n=1 Tax=Aldrovandia affinis TaxID=143900 RepID=A0AAD7R0P5_9TELE|nr:hypothetical protein AAFF_G00147460 [Aldrovandia affinis]
MVSRLSKVVLDVRHRSGAWHEGSVAHSGSLCSQINTDIQIAYLALEALTVPTAIMVLILQNIAAGIINATAGLHLREDASRDRAETIIFQPARRHRCARQPLCFKATRRGRLCGNDSD